MSSPPPKRHSIQFGPIQNCFSVPSITYDPGIQQKQQQAAHGTQSVRLQVDVFYSPKS